ncbi:MAG: methylated-DNA--[protein]-cysteine S-methyltransferase [Desulfobacula sp.]|nr:methylated-DNA--[protein]-cysteine S-methyltransferase [Desulfobacula sp.]
MYYCYVESNAGKLLLAGHDKLESLHFPIGKTRVEPAKDWILAPDKFLDAQLQLKEYFKGQRKHFCLELNPMGTAFQKQVWQELVIIPYGQTISYGELAEKIGNPNASRAVGMANGKNPISIIIPCHRVIGKNGSLTGFGGGLEVKKYLLELEQRF